MFVGGTGAVKVGVAVLAGVFVIVNELVAVKAGVSVLVGVLVKVGVKVSVGGAGVGVLGETLTFVVAEMVGLSSSLTLRVTKPVD